MFEPLTASCDVGWRRSFFMYLSFIVAKFWINLRSFEQLSNLPNRIYISGGVLLTVPVQMYCFLLDRMLADTYCTWLQLP